MKIIQIFKSFVFLILSLITILKCFFVSKKKAKLVNLKPNSPNLTDSRLEIYHKDNNSNYLHFVRGQNFKAGIKLFLRLKNIIFFNHIFNILEFFQSTFGMKTSRIKKNYIFLLSKILKFLKIKEFYSIDDYRNIHTISEICSLSGSNLIIFQHGRISPNLTYQKSLKNLKFKEYFVWNNYFKNKLLLFNRDYKKKNITTLNKFSRIRINKKNSKKFNLMIIQEDLISNKIIVKLIQKIKKLKNTKIYFKFRPNNLIDENLNRFLIKNRIKFFHQEDIYKLFKKYQINYLLASNSSLLLECSFFSIFPILFYENKPVLKDYIADQVVFHSKIKNIDKMIIKVKNQSNKLSKIRKKVWIS